MGNSKKLRALLAASCVLFATVFAAFYMYHFYWMLPGIQFAASLVYILACLVLISEIYLLKPGHNRAGIWFVVTELILGFVAFYFPLLAAPWIVLVPWLAARSAHVSLKCFGGLLHLMVLLLLLVEVLASVLFGRRTVLATSSSPDGKHRVIVSSIDSGAMGGSTVGTLDTFHPPLLHRETVYHGHYREQSEVKWLNSYLFTIDNFELDLNGKPPGHQSKIGDPKK